MNDPDGDTAGLKKRVAEFKQTNPSENYLGYFDFAKWEAAPIGYRNILKNHRDWFVYKKGLAKDDLKNRLKLRRGRGFILDVTNPEYQDYIAQKIADGLAFYQMDGLLADNIHSAPRLDEADEDLLPDEIRANWADGEIAILEKIKQRIGGEKYLFANLSRDEGDGFKRRVIAAADGVMVEDGFSPIRLPLDPASGRLASTLRAYDLAAEAGKYVIVTANTYVDGSTYANASRAKEHTYARYYLAAHLIFMKGKVFLLYHPPAKAVPQYGAEAFFSDWNIDVGEPTGDYEEIAPNVYRRAFTNAVVYLNSSKAAYSVTPLAGFDLAPDGTSAESYRLDAKSGLILSSPAALQ